MSYRVAITGSSGFIGFSLSSHLIQKEIDVVKISSDLPIGEIEKLLTSVDFVVHAAGVNRSNSESSFTVGNIDFTNQLVSALHSSNSKANVIFLSSIHSGSADIYGQTKAEAEKILMKFADESQNQLYILRLPNVFGKWSRPNYNSFLATLCWKIHRKEVYDLDDPNKTFEFIYIDSLVFNILNIINNSPKSKNHFYQVAGTQTRKLGYIESRLRYFSGLTEPNVPIFDDELDRELFAVFQYFSTESSLVLPLKVSRDERGSFAEIIHTENSGQISILICNPGQSRGHHYHNSKVEDFIHISGEGKFVTKNLLTSQVYEWKLTDELPVRVRAIPGWFHSIYNTGATPLVIAIWASEIFDKENPDTYYRSLNNE